jgi:hypothetical protein
MDAAYDYLLDLSMSMSDNETDRDAVREAHSVLVSMSSECRAPSTVWPVLPAARSRHSHRALAA